LEWLLVTDGVGIKWSRRKVERNIEICEVKISEQ
jgi:hypothetical protein